MINISKKIGVVDRVESADALHFTVYTDKNPKGIKVNRLWMWKNLVDVGEKG